MLPVRPPLVECELVGRGNVDPKPLLAEATFGTFAKDDEVLIFPDSDFSVEDVGLVFPPIRFGI